MGEYAALLILVTIIAITFLPPVSDYVKCKDMYITSVLMALNWDGYGLLGLDAVDPGEPPRCHIPVLKYPSDRTPMIAVHIIAAQIGIDNQPFLGDQDFAEPMFLIYLGSGNPDEKTNRDAVCPTGKYSGLPYPVPPNPNKTGGETWSCDEYPFASTVSWRGPASVAAVPFWEQRRQGGIVKEFYRRNLWKQFPYSMNQYPGQGAPFACVVV